ncbi:MAG: hypothetical protein KZQ91_05030 [Candidatus Thiodiazotropha sp. (ex Lucinoma borealis)]|nr:hypothetical protein [Candidatus Thiodiazotropha sp. (ex Lucinoma borealis)]
MPIRSKEFKTRLSETTGLSDSAISAAWPEWWSDAADVSPSAQAELRFSIARKLGLDPTSLLDEGSPHFIWDDSAKYKNFTGDTKRERPAITSFGVSLSRMVVKGVSDQFELVGMTATKLRESLLAKQPFVRLQDLLVLLWGIGVPVIHLRVHPLNAKRICAMAVRVGKRSAILLAKDSQYPAPIAFHLAHEIGHIALGHVTDDGGLVDMEDTAEHVNSDDPEETAADRYALELLTGDPNFDVVKQGQGHNPKQLALESLQKGPQSQIEPGTLALCYGHTTGEWGTAQAALSHIYSKPIPVWEVVNMIANQQIHWDALNDENTSFVKAVMGGI